MPMTRTHCHSNRFSQCLGCTRQHLAQAHVRVCIRTILRAISLATLMNHLLNCNGSMGIVLNWNERFSPAIAGARRRFADLFVTPSKFSVGLIVSENSGVIELINCYASYVSTVYTPQKERMSNALIPAPKHSILVKARPFSIVIQ
jgi:hypothetical protein